MGRSAIGQGVEMERERLTRFEPRGDGKRLPVWVQPLIYPAPRATVESGKHLSPSDVTVLSFVAIVLVGQPKRVDVGPGH